MGNSLPQLCIKTASKVINPNDPPPEIKIRTTLVCCTQAPVDIDYTDGANQEEAEMDTRQKDATRSTNRRRSLKNILQVWRKRSPPKHPHQTSQDSQGEPSPTLDKNIEYFTNKKVLDPPVLIHSSSQNARPSIPETPNQSDSP